MTDQRDILYLDMIGGIAGDMFAAALVDLDPELQTVCTTTIAAIHRLPESLTAAFSEHSSSGRFGKQFAVSDSKLRSGDPHQHPHLSHREAREIVARSNLPSAVRERALDIFQLLAAAEGRVHDMSADDVVFHEVGGWDSVIDIVLAARLIEELGGVDWQCGPIPIGSGSVQCAHGTLPVPAPAVLELLHDQQVFQDGHQGERVTPTGAAIIVHLRPTQLNGAPRARMLASGSGFGSRKFPGLANVLRAYRLAPSATSGERVLAIEFDIDDQTPEDLALSLEALRETDGVLDVSQCPAIGKKGRMVVQVRILARPECLEPVTDKVLSATSTLGVRYCELQRKVLPRSSHEIAQGSDALAVKVARRPDGGLTAKTEADSLEALADSYAGRRKLRSSCEGQAEALAAEDPENHES